MIDNNQSGQPSHKTDDKRSFFSRLKGGVKSIWERLDLLYWLEVGLDRIGRFIQSYEGFALIFFAISIGLSVYAVFASHVRLASGMGLFWMFLFVVFFYFPSLRKAFWRLKYSSMIIKGLLMGKGRLSYKKYSISLRWLRRGW